MYQEYIETSEGKIYFNLIRKKVKNINIKIDKEKNITITIPQRMPTEKAKEIIMQKEKWIKKHLQKNETNNKQKESKTFKYGEILYILGKQCEIKLIKSSKNNITINNKIIEIHIKEKYIENPQYIKEQYEKWLKQYAIEILEKIVQKYKKELKEEKIQNPKIKIKQMKTRWGSCTPLKNEITFSLNLIKTPIECVEYVVLHELSHFKHQNHSKNFHNYVARFMPDWKQRKKILDKEFTGII